MTMMMMLKSLLFLLLSGPTMAMFDKNVSSYLNVVLPSVLHVHNTSSGMRHNRAHFGAHFDFFRQHGHMTLTAHYANGPFCNIPDKPEDLKPIVGTGNVPFILVADDGACPEVGKARRAQQVGAAGLIIVSKHDVCGDPGSDENKCLKHLPALDDDGSGGDISIPVMLVSQYSGEEIRTAIKKKEKVLVEMAWHTPQYEHNVTLGFWHSPVDAVSQSFLEGFSDVALHLGDRLDFEPHYHILSGHEIGCSDDTALNYSDPACDSMCTHHGKYCALHHQNVNGSAIVQENLRRMCLWARHPNEKPFWDYVLEFDKQCAKLGYFQNENCLKDALKHAHIHEADIDECIQNSGGFDTESNHYLDDALEYSGHVLKTPAVWLNHLALHVPLTPHFVFEAMCFGYDPEFLPPACIACAECANPGLCMSRKPMHCKASDADVTPQPSKGSSSDGHKKSHAGFRWFMAIVILGGAAGGYVYYKKYVEDGDGLGGYSLGDALMSDTA